MSNPLALGAVTAVLRNLLANGLVEAGSPLGTVKVTAVAPDTVALDDPDVPPSLNVFLHRTTENQGWRNVALPSFDSGGSRLANPPLGLDLHYLVTAYGNADFQAEILLGHAMSVLHERPVLERTAIERALDPTQLGSLTPATLLALTKSDLADQLETITVTPEPMDSEALSRLWSALQAHYRPSAAYCVSVVLIQGTKAVRAAMPVLSRGGVDPATRRERGVAVEPDLLPPFPTLTGVTPPGKQAAAHLGDALTVAGHHLAGTAARAHFVHRVLADPIVVDLPDPTASGCTVTLPADAAALATWPPGVHALSIELLPAGGATRRESNVAVVLLAPEASAVAMTRDGARHVAVTLTVRPHVHPEQEVRLALGAHTAVAAPRDDVASTLHFAFGVLDPGPTWLRLTVDGVDSELVDHTATPPAFHASQSVTVPA